MSVFGVFLVRIFPYSDWIRRDTHLLFYHTSMIWQKEFECCTIKTRGSRGFFIRCLVSPRQYLGHWRGGTLIHPMLIIHCPSVESPEGQWDPHIKTGTRNPLERPNGFVPSTLQFKVKPLSRCTTLSSQSIFVQHW